ncbi:parathyroid hormone/parathyroid hormone-related peptide receptor-like [Physella acuta]|uniref:parathyroid hormone/parathyroid hormone-related peptide receptor-like n=1 Tax=Physella acuta TaxID=109671 RepID=UPI0027DDCDF9|nr:parathyroid hormone/parathyroid hormone-related peptide receptor-like [Physella acuta]
MEATEYSGLGAQNVDVLSARTQDLLVQAAKEKCNKEIFSQQNNSQKGSYCNTTWDGIMCWPETLAGKVAVQPCPKYIHNFYIHGTASRKCLENGEWFYHSGFNTTWTNYTECGNRPKDFIGIDKVSVSQDHLDRIKVMYSIGYGVSLVALAAAIFIMIYFRRLHCPRNTIHLNLFMSFVLRAVFSFLKDSLFDINHGLTEDIEDIVHWQQHRPNFIDRGAHWQCKVVYTTFHYVMLTSTTWVFMEGLYLYILVTITIFSERRYIRWCTVLGWAGPLLFLVPWIIVRATLEDELCWNTHPTQGYFWILKGPQVAAAVVNFIFFMNIVRVLFTKLVRSAPPRARKYRYRRLGKSTLVLIPIFEVHYLVTVGISYDIYSTNIIIETVLLYFEMFFNSFQGLLIACLFCFMNGEVQTEIRKRYIRHKLRVNSRKFQNKYVATASSQVRPRTCPSCSPKHDSRSTRQPVIIWCKLVGQFGVCELRAVQQRIELLQWIRPQPLPRDSKTKNLYPAHEILPCPGSNT